jgi:Flp pilus assembly protein TadD
LNEALSLYTKATTLGLENAMLLNDMGVLYEEIDFYARAEHYYLRSIQLDQRYLPPYINLAYLYQKLGRTEEAVQYFKRRYELGAADDPWAQKAKEELIKLRPEYKGWVASIEGEALNRQIVDQSRQAFYQTVQKSQEHYRRGQELFDDGNYRGALQEYDRAIGLTPKNPKIIDARKRVMLEMAKASVREQSKEAIRRLELGDTVSARHEIQKILTTIPEEPILISQ